MRITSWRIILFAGTVGLSVLYLLWWGRMILNPVERSGADFIAFYAAGRIAQTSGFPSIYHIDDQRAIEQEVVGFQLAEQQVLLYNHIPYLAPLLALVVNGDYVGSFARWTFFLLMIYLVSTQYFLKSLFTEGLSFHLALFASTLTFFPLFISLWQGQDTAFLYLGIVLWCAGLLRKKDWLIAIGLALVTVRPHIGIAMSVPLLIKYQKAFWRSILVISVLVSVCLAILHRQGIVEFLNVLRISSEGQWFGMKPEAMLNLLGLLIRLVKLDSIAASWIGWLIYFLGIAILGYLWWRSNRINNRLLGLSILVVLISAPHLHLHDLTLLILPLLFIVHERMAISSQWLLLPFGASFLLLLGLLLNVIYFIVPYILFVVIGYLLLERRNGGFLPGNQNAASK